MTPEQKAREAIDQRLAQAGWILQDMHQLNPMAGPGVAVLEFPTSTGPVDYALFVDGTPVSVVEAKPDEKGENITTAADPRGLGIRFADQYALYPQAASHDLWGFAGLYSMLQPAKPA